MNARAMRMGLLLALLVCAGCKTSERTNVRPEDRPRPALDASVDQLVEQYNQQARAVRSINAAVELNPVAGSAYTGVIEDYRDVRGFILAQKPSSIRMIGQAPVVAKNIFDMTSDGITFSVFIPSKQKFITGPAEFERPAKKPIENLRPQHLVDALFWREVRDTQPVVFEESDAERDRYYVLSVLRETGPRPEILRKIWFDRADLTVARIQVFAPGGRLVTDARYSDWQPSTDLRYPRRIEIARPRDDYRLGVRITKLTLNETIAAERFRLEQPAGTELVRVGEPDEKPPGMSKP